MEKATFGGGCFWCIEAAMKEIDEVKSVVSGYEETLGMQKSSKYSMMKRHINKYYRPFLLSIIPRQ
jgi:peptide methionine sulfoxide reductase MsrA